MNKVFDIKKFATAVLATLSLVIAITYAGAERVSAYEVGDVVGKAVYTDIAAYINGYPIPSYNVDGYTVIVAEDLRNYGFDVTWDGDARTLSVTMADGGAISGMSGVYKYPNAIGRKFADTLYTDIRTYVNGDPIQAYSINGYTMIELKSLSEFGAVNWNQAMWRAEVNLDWLNENGGYPEVEISNLSVPVIVLDAGHGELSGNMSSEQKTADGWVYNSSRGGWGEWRHWKSGTTWIDCEGSGCNHRGECWYPIGDGDRSLEPELTLNNTLSAAKYLEELGYEVRLTRTNNSQNPSMTKRLEYCYPNNDTTVAPDADLFICIHSNAGGGRGSAYIQLSGAYDQAGISPDYAYNGNTLGKYINDQIVGSTSMGTYSGGVIYGLPHLVLFSKCPITIAYLEIGFFDNSSDLNILRTESDGIGRAIANGVHYYCIDTGIKQY